MKKALFLLVLFVYMLFASATELLINRHQSVLPVLFKPATKEISTYDGSSRILVALSGQVRFNEEENAVESISKKGYLKYQRDDTVLYARPSGKGIQYYLEIDGDEQPLNHFSISYVAAAVKEMILWGIDGQNHLHRIFQNAGPARVLKEINALKTNQLKSTYFHYILDRSKFSDEEISKILILLNEQINENNLKISIIKKLISQYPPNIFTGTPYLIAIQSLNESNEKANLLGKLVSRDSLSEQAHLMLIQSISSLHSSSQKMKLYQAWTEQQVRFPEPWIWLLQQSSIEPAHPSRLILFRSIKRNKPSSSELDSVFTNFVTRNTHQ